MYKRMGFSLALLCAVSLTLGCGVYTFNGRGKSSIKTIAIDPFENQTNQFGLTDRLTQIIVEAFINDGTIKVVPKEMADAVLTGQLTRYERVPSKYDLSDRVEEYKVLMDFQVALKNAKDQSDLWKEQMNQEGIYKADKETEEDGQRAAGKRLVEAILNKTTVSW